MTITLHNVQKAALATAAGAILIFAVMAAAYYSPIYLGAGTVVGTMLLVNANLSRRGRLRDGYSIDDSIELLVQLYRWKDRILLGGAALLALVICATILMGMPMSDQALGTAQAGAFGVGAWIGICGLLESLLPRGLQV